MLIDTDVGPDDLRAISMLVSHRRVAAIVTTEGYSKPREGAQALRAFLSAQDPASRVPIIAGAESNNPQGFSEMDKYWAFAPNLFRRYRGASIPSKSEKQSPETPVKGQMEEALRNCMTIDVVIIGPWTSFVTYNDLLKGRIGRMVAQGQKYPIVQSRLISSFNCGYDLHSCQISYEALREIKVKPTWVDLSATNQARLDIEHEFVRRLGNHGLAARLKDMMTWYNEERKSLNIRDDFWDDSAALFALCPNNFDDEDENKPYAELKESLLKTVLRTEAALLDAQQRESAASACGP